MSQQIYAPLGPLEAKAKAMEAAVIFAKDIGIRDVIFEGDSLQVCNATNGCSLAPPAIANVLEIGLYRGNDTEDEGVLQSK